jgi:hypothetical protein
MLFCQQAGLLGAVTFEPRIAPNLPTNGRLMPIQKLGYLALDFSVFHEDINLISFSLAKVLIGHGYFDLQV